MKRKKEKKELPKKLSSPPFFVFPLLFIQKQEPSLLPPLSKTACPLPDISPKFHFLANKRPQFPQPFSEPMAQEIDNFFVTYFHVSDYVVSKAGINKQFDIYGDMAVWFGEVSYVPHSAGLILISCSKYVSI